MYFSLSTEHQSDEKRHLLAAILKMQMSDYVIWVTGCIPVLNGFPGPWNVGIDILIKFVGVLQTRC